MASRLKNIDRNTPMLLPPDLRSWVPENHIVHFILDAASSLDLSEFHINHRGTGSRQYPPEMMLALLIYCYSTGRFSSRVIEEASYSDVIVRYICGNEHPDHDTICTFRRTNGKLFQECFVKVLALAAELGQLKKVGSVSVDGTKIKASASKHSAVSYKKAGQMIVQLELEMEQLMKKAEAADTAGEDNGLSIPDEIIRREDRKARLEKARAVIEERFKEKQEEQEKEYEQKLKKRKDKEKKTGRKPPGRPPQTPAGTPGDRDQYNFTDPESRIMKAGNGRHFEQSYNAQAAVDLDGSMLILGTYVTPAANDKQQLGDVLESIPGDIRKVETVCADCGYFNEAEIRKAEAEKDLTTLIPPGKIKHGTSLEELFDPQIPQHPEAEAPMREIMIHRLKSEPGKELYRKRKFTVEPVFGIIKEVLGFRRFSLRGLKNVNTEWSLVALAYNFKRLFRLIAA